MIGKIDYNDPLFQYTTEEKRKMTQEEYCALMEASNAYVRKKHSQLREQVLPKFNTIEEFRSFYHCMPLDEAENKLNELFNK